MLCWYYMQILFYKYADSFSPTLMRANIFKPRKSEKKIKIGNTLPPADMCWPFKSGEAGGGGAWRRERNKERAGDNETKNVLGPG